MPEPKKILLVEDSVLLRNSLELAFSKRGFVVVTAQDGVQGLAKLEQATPDLILMDVVMPNMDGWEACRQVRGAADRRAIPIIIMTTKDTPADILRSFEAGANEFLEKPLDMDELFNVVDRLLQRASDVGEPNDEHPV